MATEQLTKLRDRLQEQVRAGCAKGSRSTRAIVQDFKKANADLISAARDEIDDIALIKLANETGGRSAAVLLPPAQGELSLGLRNLRAPETIVVIIRKDGKIVGRERKTFDTVTLDELGDYITDHARKKDRVPARYQALEAIRATLRPHAQSGATTVRQAADRAAEAQKASA